MKIAAAQINAKVGMTKENLQKHLSWIRAAAIRKADIIIFPEMSLTGYCREEGRGMSMTKSNEEVFVLKEKAMAFKMTVVVGAPIEIDGELYIGSFIFSPDGSVQVYTKQYLHQGEELYYSSSFDHSPVIKIGDETIVFAICADIDNPQHPKCAKENDCTLYLPSIFFSRNGIEKGHDLLSGYAKENTICILMSNYSGNLWDTEAGGRSGFWNQNGELVAALSTDEEGLLMLEKRQGVWSVKEY